MSWGRGAGTFHAVYFPLQGIFWLLWTTNSICCPTHLEHASLRVRQLSQHVAQDGTPHIVAVVHKGSIQQLITCRHCVPVSGGGHTHCQQRAAQAGEALDDDNRHRQRVQALHGSSSTVCFRGSKRRR